MTPTPAAPSRSWHFDLLVADGFVLLEVAGIIDALRVANRIRPQPLFSWTYRSARGGEIASRCEAFVKTEPFAEKPRADYAFVIGNSDPDCPALSLAPVIETYTYRNARVFLLAEAASRYIREQARRDPNGALPAHTAHWENQAFLRERTEEFEANYAIATDHGQVVTCAGMGATIDVILTVIGQHMSSAEKMNVADVMLHEKIRDYGALQPFSGMRATTTGDAELDQCIELMQANIEDPIPIRDLVRILNISSRSLERKFRTFLNTTPNMYYRELRLTKANNLLFNTTLSVGEIGLACGFPSGFSTLYRKFFGVTPNVVRQQKRMSRNTT